MTRSKNTLPLFRTAYDGLQNEFSDKTATDFTVPDDETEYHPSRSMTNQSDAEELDANNIMARYLKTGLVPSSRLTPFWGDVSALPSFQEAQQILIDANRAFEDLPAKVRDRFLNDPARFLEFMGDKENEAEARKLGLLDPLKEPEAPAAVAERAHNAGAAKAAPSPSSGKDTVEPSKGSE